jgi:ubiquinol-cytochrome c reductase iron-sulfur subunit
VQVPAPVTEAGATPEKVSPVSSLSAQALAETPLPVEPLAAPPASAQPFIVSPPAVPQPSPSTVHTPGLVQLRTAGPADELPPRSQDRNLDAESGVNLSQRTFWGTALAGSAFWLACAAGIAFLVAWWIGASNAILGGTLAVSLAAFGATLVVWARWLTVRREAVEARKPLLPPQEVRDAAAGSFLEGAQDIQRRSLLRWVGLEGIALAASTVISLLRSIGFPSSAELNSRVWKRGQRLVTTDGKPVPANSLEPGVTLIVFPEDSIGAERAQTILLRVDPNLLRLPKDRANWAPLGNVAYSRVCTHAGCTVGLYEKTSQLLMCPCHQSTFDVLRAARPNGGPAARALPQLPLYADGDGNLRAAGGFSDPPGPGFWGMA